jgi:hypothetical protein
MRAWLAVVTIVACAAPPPASSPPTAHAPPPIDCTRAGAAIAAVVGVAGPFATRCREDRWSDAAARCFARAGSAGALVSCAGKLDDAARRTLFGLLADRRNERVYTAIRAAEVAERRTGIDECDAFIAAVARAFACEAIPLDDRLLLDDVTTDFPVDSDNPRLRARFAELCARSLAGLQQQTALVGCGS